MEADDISLERQFELFSKFGKPNSSGRTIKLSQIDKWFKQANILNRNLTTTDTGLTFNRYKSSAVNYTTFLKFVNELARYKSVDGNEIKLQLLTCGAPIVNTEIGGSVNEMSSIDKYPMEEKLKFDEAGEGKSISAMEAILTEVEFMQTDADEGYDKIEFSTD